VEKRVIGILGGMGPRATAPFLELVIDQCTVQYGAKYDEDFPPIMVYSLPTPFYMSGPINHTLMKETIIEGLQKLESTGVSFIVMPCSSAHMYFDELEKCIDIPLLNNAELTINSLPLTSKSQRITIFATKATLTSGIYQKAIISAGHESVFKKNWQEKVNKIIQMIRGKEDIRKISLYWNELILETEKFNIETIIIGCTDLNILKSMTETQVNIIDSGEALAKAAIKRFLYGTSIFTIEEKIL